MAAFKDRCGGLRCMAPALVLLGLAVGTRGAVAQNVPQSIPPENQPRQTNVPQNTPQQPQVQSMREQIQCLQQQLEAMQRQLQNMPVNTLPQPRSQSMQPPVLPQEMYQPRLVQNAQSSPMNQNTQQTRLLQNTQPPAETQPGTQPPLVGPMNPGGQPQAQFPMQTDPLPAPADPSVQSDNAPTQPTAPAPFDWTRFRLGGQYRIEGDANDFPQHAAFISNNQQNDAFVSQRFRLWLTYSPNENVEGYIQMQVGGLNWGTNFDFNKNFGGNFTSLPDDRVGIELRRAWLAVKDADWGKVRVGFLDWHDEFDDTMASSDYDFNIGGIDWENTFKAWNDFHARAAMLLLSDQAFATTDATDEPGSHTAILYALDVDQPLPEKSSIGASVYYLNDGGGYSYPTVGAYSSSWDVWLGVRGKLGGPLPVSGFFLLDLGGLHTFGDSYNHTGFAGQLQLGPVDVGPGKLSTQVVVSSGSSSGIYGGGSFRTLAQTGRDNYGAEGYWSYMHITSANAPSDVRDLGVSLQDQGYGLFTPQMKYELPLSKKLLSTTSVGWFRTTATNPVSGGSVIGTELAQMFSYDFGGGLTLDVGAAVLFTGDFYRASQVAAAPANIYESFARFQLEF